MTDDNITKTVFLSYCSSDSDIANIVDNSLTEQLDKIYISRYTRDVKYKESFKKFMQSIGQHDFVITIVSDSYLKSRACMFEVGEIVKNANFQKKIIFIILSDKDAIYYNGKSHKNIEAEIYNPLKRNEYILYWENEYRVLEASTSQIDSDVARIESLKLMREIKKIIDYDLGAFLDYLSDAKGLSFQELVNTNFSAIMDEIDPGKANRKIISSFVNIELNETLIAYKKSMFDKLKLYPYEKNIFIMMKYREHNNNLYCVLQDEIRKYGLNCVRADMIEWNITNNIYNPMAVLSCCKYGIAIFDEPEESLAYSPNVVYELATMYNQGKKCLVLKHDSLLYIPFDLVKDYYYTYRKEIDIKRILGSWMNRLSA